MLSQQLKNKVEQGNVLAMFKQFNDLLDVFFSHGVELLSTGERVFGKYSKNILNWEYAECNGNCSR